MPRPLPLRIQVEVLGHLRKWKGWEELVDDIPTLHSCSLVCKAWCRVCQRKLLRVEGVEINNHRKLERFVALLSSSAVNPIGTYVTHLELWGNICHIAPFYLATKLPSLRRLNIIVPYPDPFVVRSSLVMHLKHFRTVTELELSWVQFQSFWELRRLVVALPALSTLHLYEVELVDPNPFQKRVPSLLTFPQNLTCVSVSSSTLNPLWLWAYPFRTQYQKPTDHHSRPLLTQHDTGVIWEFFHYICRGRLGWGSKFKWLYDEDDQLCEHIIFLSCRAPSHLATS